jgi:hypothetical protein
MCPIHQICGFRINPEKRKHKILYTPDTGLEFHSKFVFVDGNFFNQPPDKRNLLIFFWNKIAFYMINPISSTVSMTTLELAVRAFILLIRL